MKRRHLLNLLLLLLLLGGIGIAYYTPGKKSPAPLQRLITSHAPLQQLLLTQPGNSIRFEQRGVSWWITQPFVAPANRFKVQQLIDIGNSDASSRYPVEGDLKKYALSEPALSLQLGEQTLYFGNTNPIDSRRYVRLGAYIYLLPDAFYRFLTAPPTDFVEKKLLSEEAHIRAIHLPGGVSAIKSADSGWQLDPPSSEHSDVVEIVSNWQSARAIDVRQIPLATATHSTPEETVQIELEDGKSVDFSIVQREPELILDRLDWGLRYEVVGENAKRLLSFQSH